MIVNGKVYTIVKFLGRGCEGESYLVADGKSRYTLKGLRRDFGIEKLKYEMKRIQTAYERLCSLDIPVPRLYELDYENFYILKEYIEGKSALYYVVSDQISEDCIQQLKNILKKAYSENVVIDCQPANFVVTGGKLIYIDYACRDMNQDVCASVEELIERFWSKSPSFTHYMLMVLNQYSAT